jgi:hypothetical protein
MHASLRPSKPTFGYQTATYLVRRGGVWQYCRRVPKHLTERLDATEIRISTKARDRTDALRAAASISAALEAQWAKLSDVPPAGITACVDFQAALATADALGVAYRPAADIAASRLEDLLERVEKLAQPLDLLARSSAVSACATRRTIIIEDKALAQSQ